MAKTAEELKQQIAETAENTAALQQYWESESSLPPPPKNVFSDWLRKFDFEIIVQGIDAWNVNYSKQRSKIEERKLDAAQWHPTSAKAVRYASGAMWKIKRGSNHQFADGTPYPDNWETLNKTAKQGLIVEHCKENLVDE
jgi:hypothetical protein